MASTFEPHPPPQPAYQATSGSILNADRKFYDSIATSECRTLQQTIDIPPRSGKAWKVSAGSIVRFSTPEGPQVGDLNIWNLSNSRERFWAARTRQLQASHVTVYDRLWSCLPYLRPMVTIIADSLKDYGVDHWGGRCHDLLGGLGGFTVERDGIDVFMQAHDVTRRLHLSDLRELGLLAIADMLRTDAASEFDIHDVINIFQVTGLNAEGKYFMEPSPAKKGEYLEFFAEQDLIMALSACPGGDLSAWGWGEGGAGEEGEKKSMLECCRPLKVEVYSLDDEALLKGWSQPQPPKYTGLHGMKVPVGENLS